MSPRQIGLIAAVFFAIVSPIVQAVGRVGLTAAQFADAGNETLRAAGYAFSIWSVIYAGLVAFAVYQALPRQRADPLIQALAAPALVAIVGTGLWIWASAFNARWASVAIIVVSAAALTWGLLRAPARNAAPSLQTRGFVWWPLSLLAGWLTIASAINILTVLTAEGLIGSPAARPAAVAGVLAVAAIALAVMRARRLAVYGVPIAWGLVGVWVAEKGAKGEVAALALGAAVLVGAYAVWRLRPVRA